MAIDEQHAEALEKLAAALRQEAWQLAFECVQEGLRDDAIPSLVRVGALAQLGDVPTFIAELARELAEPSPARMRQGIPLATLARDHAREREALGFAPREVVTEFLLLRRVLWRFVSRWSAELGSYDVILVERRLNDTIDRLVTECVVAYFDRATAELAELARHDALTGLLNHQAFTNELEMELERARRYKHGVTLVFFDIDRFKEINDTLGHPEGDRILQLVAQLLRDTVRRTDIAGRMGGDEFAGALVESDAEVAGIFMERLVDRFDERAAGGDLPADFKVSPGVAHFPTEAEDGDALFRVADSRLYEVKRAAQS